MPVARERGFTCVALDRSIDELHNKMVSTFIDELGGGLDGLDWSRQEREASVRGRVAQTHWSSGLEW